MHITINLWASIKRAPMSHACGKAAPVHWPVRPVRSGRWDVGITSRRFHLRERQLASCQEENDSSILWSTVATISSPQVEIHKCTQGGSRTQHKKHKPSRRPSSGSGFKRIARFEDLRCERIPQSEIGAVTEVLPQDAMNFSLRNPFHSSPHQ